VKIYYRFHPHTGRSVPLIGRNVYAGVAVVTVRQPDGTAAYIPEWMTYPEAERMSLRSPPRLPLSSLQDLKHVVAAIMGSLARNRDSNDGGNHVTARHPPNHTPAGPIPPNSSEPGIAGVDSHERRSAAAASAAGSHNEGGSRQRKRDRS